MGETPPAPALRLTSEPARTRQSKRARVPCRRVRVWAVAVTLTVCGCLRSALFLMLSLLLLTNVPGPALDMWCGDLGAAHGVFAAVGVMERSRPVTTAKGAAELLLLLSFFCCGGLD